MRENLPYGKWTCADGREVLFNRRYIPLWERSPSGVVAPANPKERVPKVREEWFYPSDSKAPWHDKATRERCEAALTAWGLEGNG